MTKEIRLSDQEIIEMGKLTGVVTEKGCCNCGTTERSGTVRMIVPKAWGGRVVESNLYFICDKCSEVMLKVEAERRAIINRAISEGMHRASAEGKQIGRKKLTKEELPKEFYDNYFDFLKGAFNKTEYAEKIGVSRPTLNRYIAVMTGKR